MPSGTPGLLIFVLYCVLHLKERTDCVFYTAANWTVEATDCSEKGHKTRSSRKLAEYPFNFPKKNQNILAVLLLLNLVEVGPGSTAEY